MESYIIFFSVICVVRIFEYFTLIRRSVLLDAKIYLQSVADFKEKDTSELVNELADLSTELD